MADCLVEFKIIHFYNTFIDKYFIEKNPIKLYNEAEVDSTNSTRHHFNGFPPNSTGLDQIIRPGITSMDFHPILLDLTE